MRGARVGRAQRVGDGGDPAGRDVGAVARVVPGAGARRPGQRPGPSPGRPSPAPDAARARRMERAAALDSASRAARAAARNSRCGKFRGVVPFIVGEAFRGAGQSGAPEQGARVAVVLQPEPGRLGQPPMVAQPLPVRLDPVAQPRPAGDQRLVGELDGRPRRRSAAGRGPAAPPPRSTSGHSLSTRSAPVSGRRVSGVPWPGSTIRSSRCRAASACRCGQLPVRLLGARRDGAAHPAGRLVAARVSTRPLRRRQVSSSACETIGSPPASVEDLRHDPRGQLPLHQEPDLLRRLGDRLAQLVRGHRADQRSGAAHRLRQPPELATAGKKSARTAMNTRSRLPGVAFGKQLGDEPGSLGPVPAQGEELLELVHHHPALRLVRRRGQQMRVRGGRPVARASAPAAPPGGPWSAIPAGEPGYQSGPQQGGLPAARGAEHRGEPVLAHQLEQLLRSGGPARRTAAWSSGSNRARPRYGGVRVLARSLASSPRRPPPRRPSTAAPTPPGRRRRPVRSPGRRRGTAAVRRPRPATALSGRSPAASAIVRYEGLPAVLRSSRSSCASRGTGPAVGSSGSFRAPHAHLPVAGEIADERDIERDERTRRAVTLRLPAGDVEAMRHVMCINPLPPIPFRP